MLHRIAHVGCDCPKKNIEEMKVEFQHAKEIYKYYEICSKQNFLKLLKKKEGEER